MGDGGDEWEEEGVERGAAHRSSRCAYESSRSCRSDPAATSDSLRPARSCPATSVANGGGLRRTRSSLYTHCRIVSAQIKTSFLQQIYSTY